MSIEDHPTSPASDLAKRAPTAASALSPSGSRRQQIGRLAGPAVAALLLVLPAPEGLEIAAWRTAAVGLWMAIWWMSEALPIAVTSLLPMIAFPILGIVGIREASAPFANPLIFLFLGGFLIALALEEVGLHRRIALGILGAIGTSKRQVVLGFMLASAALSMWISNTATAMMMLPIALSVARRLGDGPAATAKTGISDASSKAGAENFNTCLLLGVAYACSLGGVATLVGTPTNALLAAFLLENHGYEISFTAWMGLALPISALGLLIIFLVLTRWLYPLSAEKDLRGAAALNEERESLGTMSAAERRVGLIFLITAGLWLTRPLIDNLIPGLSDTGIALFGALLLFAWPLARRTQDGGTHASTVLDWSATHRLPWGVLLLFGGGLSLASTIQSTGLAAWIGSGLARFESWPMVVVVLLTVALVVFLTELTSNTATAAAFLPVLASIAIGLAQNPLLLLVPATIAASCAFMLPVATPPNAIVFGSGRISLGAMAQTGWRLNLVFILLVTAATFLLLPVLLGVEGGVLPAWAVTAPAP